jgi:hypothetical protein
MLALFAASLSEAPAGRKLELELDPLRKDHLRCYAMRYPDILQGYCKGLDSVAGNMNDNSQESEACNWDDLEAHYKSAGISEKRVLTCAHEDVVCYAERYPDLVRGYCGGDISSCSHTNQHDLLKHYVLVGLKEGRQFGCQTATLPTTSTTSSTLNAIDTFLEAAAAPVSALPTDIALAGSPEDTCRIAEGRVAILNKLLSQVAALLW